MNVPLFGVLKQALDGSRRLSDQQLLHEGDVTAHRFFFR
jgi:hypothetical protein